MHNSMESGEAVAWMLLIYLLLIALVVAVHVLIGLAAYNDAKAKMNDSPAMWGWLVGIFGLIPGIIYLVTRNNNSKRMVFCPNCGWANPGDVPACMRCRAPNPYLQQFVHPDADRLMHKAKVQMIWGLILYGLAIVVPVLLAVIVSFSVYRVSGGTVTGGPF